MQRDTRRRRVLNDEVIATSAPPAGAPRQRRRASAAGSEKEIVMSLHDPRVTDLIPKGWVTLTLLFTANLAIIAGLGGLYFWMPQLAPMTNDGVVAAFDLDNEGSLGTWYSAALLAVASVVAFLVFWIRRQRADDYFGRYRIWMWATLCWLVMSIDEGSSLHEGFKEMMSLLTGTRLMGDGSLWWAIPYATILTYVGVRLLLDMRPCRWAIVTFMAAGGMYVLAVATQLDLVVTGALSWSILLEETAEMVANLFLLTSMVLTARYRTLEAYGLLPAVEAKDEDQASEKPAGRRRSVAGKQLRMDTAHATPGTPASKSRKSAAPTETVAAGNSAGNSDSAGRKLSRAERKAQRRGQGGE